jgi:nucleotide-binding universal stress UspA family protein
MYQKILIATDGSDLAKKAVDQGLALAKALGAKALAITVSEPLAAMASGDVVFSYPIAEYEKNVAAVAAAVLGSVNEAAKRVGIACETMHVKDRHPAEGIVETAKQQNCDLIVMASHGRRGLSRALLGSQANKVVTLSDIPVLICR